MNTKRLGKWSQYGSGMYKFIDPARIRVELQPSWYFGVSVYEVKWEDNDHLNLRAADRTIHLSRTK